MDKIDLENPVVKAKIKEAKEAIEKMILGDFKVNTTVLTKKDEPTENDTREIIVSYMFPKECFMNGFKDDFYLASKVVIDMKEYYKEQEMINHYEKTGERIQYRSDVK